MHVVQELLALRPTYLPSGGRERVAGINKVPGAPLRRSACSHPQCLAQSLVSSNRIRTAYCDFTPGLGTSVNGAISHLGWPFCPHETGPKKIRSAGSGFHRKEMKTRDMEFNEFGRTGIHNGRTLWGKPVGDGHDFCRVPCFDLLALLDWWAQAYRLIPKALGREARYLFLTKEAGHEMTNTIAASAYFKSCMLSHTRCLRAMPLHRAASASALPVAIPSRMFVAIA